MKKGCWWTFLGLSVISLYGGVRLLRTYWDYGDVADRLPEVLPRYRALGLPWTAEDLDQHVKPEENAAPLVREAMAAMPDKKIQDLFGYSKFAGARNAAVPKFNRALSLLHQAVQKPKLDYDRDWDLGPYLMFPEGASIKCLVRVLGFRAEQEAIRGDDDQAIDDLEDAKRIASLTAQEPVLISTLVSASCHALNFAAAERCLAQAAGSGERLERYRTWISEPVPIPDLRNAFRYEMYSTVALMRNLDIHGALNETNPLNDLGPFLETDSLGAPPSQLRRDGLPPNIRAQAYLTHALLGWTELFESTHYLSDDPAKIRRVWQAIDERNIGAKGFSHRLDAIVFPVFAQSLSVPQSILVNQRIETALAEAMAMRLRTGIWPTAVRVIDPFAAKPLHVRFDGKRFRVWSVGKNMTDDGGLTRREAALISKESDDMVAAYPPITVP